MTQLGHFKIHCELTAEYEDWKSECQAAKKDLAITEIYKGCDSEDLKCTAAIREGEFEKDLKGTARRCTGSLGGCQGAIR